MRSNVSAPTSLIAPRLVYRPTNVGGVTSGVVNATRDAEDARLGDDAASSAATCR